MKVLKLIMLSMALVGLIFACKAKETEITKAPSKETEQVQAQAPPAPIVKAGAPLTPETLSDVTIVDGEWVLANYQKMKVYDYRIKAEYVEGHIPGAISSIYTEESKWATDFDPSKDKFDLSKFPADKNTPIIAYCNGQR
jgi:rhodanese-related sulfurtransferase